MGIIQARTRSKRLRNKVMMKLGNKTILEILLTRLTTSRTLDKIVVATTTKKEDDIIEKIVLNNGFEIFRGSERDVLDRYYNATREYNADIVVRITADNPLTDINLLDFQVELLAKANYDYVAPKEIILGLGSEALTFDALKKAWENAEEPYQREHVTPYIYEHPEIFKIKYVTPTDFLRRKDIRLTVDTIEDFKLYQELYNHFGNLINVNIKDIIEFLDSNPQVRMINAHIRQKCYREVER